MAATAELLGEAGSRLAAAARDVAIATGLVRQVRDEDLATARHMPFALLPFKYPRSSFRLAKRLSPAYGRLIHAASRDAAWLQATLAGVAASDPFAARLLAVHGAVYGAGSEGPAQAASLTLFRSDYMLDAVSGALLQVELNTFCCGGHTEGQGAAAVQRYILSRYMDEVPAVARFMSSAGAGGKGGARTRERAADADGVGAGGGAGAGSAAAVTDASRPVHRSSLEGAVETYATAVARGRMPPIDLNAEYAAAMAQAFRLAAKPAGAAEQSVVLIVYQEHHCMVHEQRKLEMELWQRHSIKVERATFTELVASARLDEASRDLTVHGKHVAVVYFRSGFLEEDYPSSKEWDVRLALERSNAVKCPDVGGHLLTLKKIQEVFAQPGVVERFVSAEDATLLRSSFAGQWSLDSAEDGAGHMTAAEAVAMAVKDPSRFVLKPQREGGGNNLYGEELKRALLDTPPAERAHLTLMQRIEPESQATLMVRDGTLVAFSGVTELGMMAAVLGDDKAVLLNRYTGHFTRTKPEDADEGGVCAGVSGWDSVYLVDEEEEEGAGTDGAALDSGDAPGRISEEEAAGGSTSVSPVVKEA